MAKVRAYTRADGTRVREHSRAESQPAGTPAPVVSRAPSRGAQSAPGYLVGTVVLPGQETLWDGGRGAQSALGRYQALVGERGNRGEQESAGASGGPESRGEPGERGSEQLAMFYTAAQIKEGWGILPADREFVADQLQEEEGYHYEARDYYEEEPLTDAEFWSHRRQENEASAPDFEKSIRRDGVYSPVTLGVDYIQDGHHRLAATRDEQLIPAVHADGSGEIGRSSPTVFRVDGHQLPSPQAVVNEGEEDDWEDEVLYDPENPGHRLVGGSYEEYLKNVEG